MSLFLRPTIHKTMRGMGINNSKCPYYDLKIGKSNHKTKPCISRSHNAKNFKKIKINPKTHKITQKAYKKGVIGHDMATTQPTNPQIDHPNKRKFYPN